MICYCRTILRDLHNLTSVTAEWRKSEAVSLAALVQKRIQHLQVVDFLLYRFKFRFPYYTRIINYRYNRPTNIDDHVITLSCIALLTYLLTYFLLSYSLSGSFLPTGLKNAQSFYPIGKKRMARHMPGLA